MRILPGHPTSNMRLGLRWTLLGIGLIVAAGWLAATHQHGIKKRPNEFVVGILVDPVFYQPASTTSEASGFELEALQAFADSRQKRLRLVPAANPGALVELLADGDRSGIDFIASTPIRADTNLRYSAPLREERPLVVQHADSVPLGGAESLARRTVEVLPGTLQEAALQELAATVPMTIERPLVASEIDLLGRIANRQAELAATDTAHFDVAVNFFPDLWLRRNWLAGSNTLGASAPAIMICATRPTRSSPNFAAAAGLPGFTIVTSATSSASIPSPPCVSSRTRAAYCRDSGPCSNAPPA